MGLLPTLDDLKKNMVIIVIALVAFLSLTVFLFFKYFGKRTKPEYVENKEFITKENKEEVKKESKDDPESMPTATVMLFSAGWCPYCKKLEEDGTYATFKAQNNGKLINGYKLIVKQIDCTNDQDAQIQTNYLDKYNVDGFPSIKLIKEGDDSPYDFDAKPTLESLNKFIQDIVN